ncbi:MAG: type I methionyl aminopeptidase [Bacteroidota bacterium]|nr:type I methionyl aminopeptidase [Bacteroidota bacterium]MDP4225164.1 type I methionyl aminopeptidase [Bacteroidota bacterium]MDP4272802.1 type I methionyl aminopeptidase [Bacteroidota bacterium]
MLILKNEEEIELLRENNLLVSKTLGELAKHIQPGITTLELDKIAEEFIRDHGAVPGFLGYDGFPNSICASVNSEVVHGFPSSYVLKDGDIISIDCGTLYKGFYGDSAYTFPVGNVKQDVLDLLQHTKEALELGVKNAIDGKRIGDIGYAIQSYVENFGYSVVREMVGHGLGRDMHEEPEVPNYGRRGSGIKLRENMVICIEPMINLGTKYIEQDSNGWTIKTRDNKPSAHFEYAVAVKKNEPDVLTTFKYIDEVLSKNN